MNKKKFAVIDIGTLKVKLQIVETAKSLDKSRIIQQSNTLTCLGVRMEENNNKPWPNYLKQTIDELHRCKKTIERENVDRMRVVSTHALREMGKVGEEIALQIKREVGLPVEIISQQEEAELFYKAVLRDFNTTDNFTVVDVGGGSVQVLIGNKKKLVKSFLLKCGAQLLFDRFSPRHTGNDFPTRSELRKMEKYILEQLSPIPTNIKTPVIYGSSVIIDLFKTIGLKMESFELSKTHPYKIDTSELRVFLDRIASMPYDQREEQYKFPQKYYMWGIDKAFLSVLKICQKVRAPYLVPSNTNINQGLLLSLIS